MPSPTIVLPEAHPQAPALAPDLHLGHDHGLDEVADEEGGHRGEDDPPVGAEHPLIGVLPGPARRDRQMDHGPFHQRHEGERDEAGPDRAPRAGVAVDLGQHVIDQVGDREEQDSRPERPRADPRERDERALLGADHVRQQEDDHERDEDEVEIAEVRAVQRPRLDLPQPLPFGFHAGDG